MWQIAMYMKKLLFGEGRRLERLAELLRDNCGTGWKWSEASVLWGQYLSCMKELDGKYGQEIEGSGR